MIKRLLDILVSLIAILLLAVPMLVIAAAIRLTSTGPAVFRQRRVGQAGRAFTIFKFRTMRSGTAPYGSSPHSADDPRLTRIGRLLRETSLDELPQFFNILAGQMSLVGPRPLYERQAALWNGRQRSRLDVRPGLTGYAQVYGRGGMTHEEKIELDLYYVTHQSFLLDLRIVLRTLVNLFTRQEHVYERQYSRRQEHETPGDRPRRAVIFDLDDTLYPEREYVLGGYRAAAELLRSRTGRNDRFENWLWERFLAGKTDRAFNALGEAFDLNLTGEQVSELVSAYRGHRPDIRPYEGIVETLTSLKANWRLGLLSDGFLPAQQWKLDALALAGLFDAVLFTESLGREFWKPSPAGYETLREQLGVPDEACVYVGDNPAKDFIAPNRLGWRTIRLIQPGQVHASQPPPAGGEAGVVVASVAEMVSAMSR